MDNRKEMNEILRQVRVLHSKYVEEKKKVEEDLGGDFEPYELIIDSLEKATQSIHYAKILIDYYETPFEELKKKG